ncbi:hypothetical protein ACXM5X_34600, partial [Pseudomonas saponiphila]
CINSAMTICPKGVKTVPVSTTTSPVTVTAEVAVNRLCSQVIDDSVAIGSLSKQVPKMINNAKLTLRIMGGAPNNFLLDLGLCSIAMMEGCH